ncbi:hypothetical protein [Clostridium sp. JN-1]|uniref:hypothetical protein n=1 Tax=Clostridium sp. JN-1 TaxID=2483110 RepID=UPI000F0AFEA4|nr:hypothetical protein [Clostridium sp. JN-1]
MVKIEVSATTRKQINDNHREYIEQESLPKLEAKIKEKKMIKKRKFLMSLFGDTPEKRKDSLVNYCLSANLKNIVDKFNNTFFRIYGFEFSNSKKHKRTIEAIRKDLNSIFNYGGFNSGTKLSNGRQWSRHKFITSLGAKVCPYCNRQYITSYESEADDMKTTADADHYYPKVEYPILQMNIFNLIPSCSVCNSRMKGKKNKKHLYPYEDSSDSLVFKIPLETSERVSEITIDTKNNKRAEASVEVFKLDKVYQAHLDEASEVKKYAEEYFEFGNKVYEATYGLSVPFDIFSTWFSFMGKDIPSEPLIKLRQDIFKQLKEEYKK